MRDDCSQPAQACEWAGEPTSPGQKSVPAILPCGDAALTVEFSQTISTAVNARVLGLDAALNDAGLTGVIETAPAYRSLLVCYDPLVTTFAILKHSILALCEIAPDMTSTGRGWVIPVAYGSAHGFDLDEVAGHHATTVSEIVRRHTSARYRVFMVGFLPGFTYLGGLDARLATPRRPVPRVNVPAGSIVIGGVQTAIGSIAGPSGWHVIGATPVRAFMPHRDPAIFMKPGDEVVFEEISGAEYISLSALAARGALVARPLT